MAVSTQALVRDNSTLVNFKQWAKAISDFFVTAGWTQASDTGQVNWSSIASVPTAGNFVYEIWQPNDGLTTFYLKVEYGTNTASTNTGPQIRVSIGTTTNGAGTLTGFVTSTQSHPNVVVSVTSTTTQWQCHFSGDSGRMAVMMWRDDNSGGGGIFFAVQRSLNNSGTPTSTHVTLMSCGNVTTSSAVGQQTLVFGTGVGNSVAVAGTGTQGLVCIRNSQLSSQLFNGNISISPIFPDVGYFDNPLDIMALGAPNDFTEGSQYTIAAANMPYGIAHTYIATKNNPFSKADGATQNNAAVLMRYD